MKWEINSERPVYIQLIEQIQASIVSGNFKPSDKLPSVRELAAEASVNPNTMQKALSELERTGLIYSNRTSGRYITSDLTLIKDLKRKSAKNLILDFLDKMNQLGFEKEEVISMLSEAVKEME
ncbi:GntR family transcriptional regulator [Clostridium omnivorum]|uniref:GntR family transcriptional regulator n=1 Tax=Clostridium omnivorum TaxID=1604902 RepID=A0ABQ5N7T5_9CLOT|nr:GntR family transcriptional regulator [Clostridium sp. E14]GLC31247.1 GntR family transcriptional regulator [Clostridium sp. E14]